MHLTDLFATLDAAIAANGGRVLNLKTGTLEPITPGALTALRSSVRQTVLYHLEQRLGPCGDPEARLGTVDLRPHLPLLEAAAKERARGTNGAREHARGGNAAAHVRRVLRICFPAQFGRPRSKGAALAVPAAWAPLLEAVDRRWTHPQTRRQNRSDLARLARVMFAAGYEAPACLPDRDTIEDLLRQERLAASSIDGSLNAYRAVVLLLQREREEASTPAAQGAGPALLEAAIPKRVGKHETGLRSLPRAAFPTLPADQHPAAMTAETLLPYIAPHLAEAYADWRASAAGRAKRPATYKDVLRALSTAVAWCYRHPGLLEACRTADGERVTRLADLELHHFYELLHVATVEQVVTASSRTAARALRNIAGREVVTPFISRLVDDLAADLRPRSVVQGLPYPAGAVKVEESLWSLVADVLGPAYQTAAGERWAFMKARHTILWQRMEAANEAAPKVTGRKNKALLIRTVTLPLLVCVILPRLAARVRRLERRWADARDRAAEKGHAPERHPKTRRAYESWEDALEEYLSFAATLTDPLRVKNTTFGWLGATHEYRPEVVYDAQGHPVRITAVKSYFTQDGGANPEAALKQTEKADRSWRWAPAMVDFDLVLQYLMGPRRRRIVQQRLLVDASGAPVTAETYRLDRELAGHYLLANKEGMGEGEGHGIALFVSPDDSHRHGAYASDKISNLFGRALHHAVTEILGVPGVPPYEECGRKGCPWRALFAHHVARLFWGTYWLGVRETDGPVQPDGTRLSGVRIAMDATSDEEKTLRDEYAEVSGEVRDRMRDAAGDWSHPRTYDRWMNRVYLLERIDWASESVPLPPVVAAADAAPQRAPWAVEVRRARRLAAAA